MTKADSAFGKRKVVKVSLAMVLAAGLGAIPMVPAVAEEPMITVQSTEDAGDSTLPNESTRSESDDASSVEEVENAEELNKALSNDGDAVIKLTKDVAIENTLSVSGSKTLDLNGRSVTGDIGTLISVPAGASLTIQDDAAVPGKISGGTIRTISVAGSLTLTGGEVSSDAASGQTVLISGAGSCITMTGGTIHGSKEALRGQWATIDVSGGVISTNQQATESGPLLLLATDATLSGNARIEGYYGVTLFNITGAGAVDNDETSDPSSFIMDGGSIDCVVFAISGNNTQSATCSATINGGTITSEDTAIYWPMEGELTVAGGSITGGNAIEAKMGTINITGGILRGTGDYGFAYSGNGSASDGSAVKLVGQLYGGSEGQFINTPNLTVNVTGGTLESAAGNAMTVYADGVESAYGGGDLTASVTVSATAKLTPAKNYDALRATSVGEFDLSEAGATTGNTTINSPELAAAAVVATGQTQTGASSSQNGNTLYTSVARAIASATADDVAPDTGTTITLLRDVDEDITVPDNANLTLDLGNHTLSGSVVNNGTLKMEHGTFEGQASGNGVTTGEGITTVVAKIDDQGYSSIQDAVNNATEGQTVTLVANVTESINIPANKTLALDLNGFTLTNEDGNHTINNYGVLTVNDSAGGGAVDNVSHGRAALYNYADATAVLNGGTFKRSKETGSAGNVGGGNSWYTIRNKGMMTLNSGVTVESLLADGSLSKFSSVICNGFNSSEVASEYEGESPTLIIDGATIRGGLYVKNDYHGTLEMRSGDVRGSSAGIFNYADATISGGTVSVDLPDRGAVWNYAETASGVTTTPTLNITGGTIDGSDKGQMAVRQSVDGSGIEPGAVTVSGGEFRGSITTDKSIPTGTSANIHISGGTFTSAPNEEFLTDGFEIVDKGDGSFGVVKDQPVIPSKPTYSATVADAEHGAVKVSPARATAGTKVTVTATPDEGFKVSKVSVADKGGEDVKVTANSDGTYTFEMPSGGATVTVEFACDGGELCPSHGLVDVEPGEWYHAAVDWAVSTGLMGGYDDGSHTFGPDDSLTRAQLAQILYNQAGKPASDGDVSQFSDCAPGAWYAPAVSWAADQGLLKGYDGQGTFGPDDVLTREQLAIVFWRIAGEPGAEADLSTFPDGSETSPWAEGAVEWAVSTGLLQGYDNTGELDPAGDITRAQAATVFMREADAE